MTDIEKIGKSKQKLVFQPSRFSHAFRPKYCLYTKMSIGTFYIGTSNIVVPGNRNTYPPAYMGKSRLNYYSSFFNSLEINSSFYKIPMPVTFEKWANDVPRNFRFTVKLWKEITHVKELNADLAAIGRFLEAAGKLAKVKGCLLVQFPGKITVEYYNQVETILDTIKQNNPSNDWRIALEFRNDSWYIGETFDMADHFGAAVVIHDAKKGRNYSLNKTAPFVYLRFHGPAGDYRGSYGIEQLNEWAIQIKSWLTQHKDVYAYFNNTMGEAFENAGMLQAIINK